MGGVNRRAVLSYSLGIGAAAAAGIMRKGDDARARAAAARPFHAPRVLRSSGGLLDVALTARPALVDVGARRPADTYTYNGLLPGRTWEVRGGDTLRVRLRNRLPPLSAAAGPAAAGGPADRPRGWTTTNLHTHGLHVSPAGSADNVFLAVPPGADHHLEIDIPAGHPGGIFWYHPHHHGGVAQQVRAGMAWALIVRGGIDEVEEVAAAAERVMVLQAIELDEGYRLADPVPEPAAGQAFFPRARVLYTVNGRLAPALVMYPGEVQRWRLVNASAGTFMSLRLTGHELHVLAWDGLTLPAPEPAREVMLPPGGRAEALVRAGRPGRYGLVLTPGSSKYPDIPGMPRAGLPQRDGGQPLPGFPPVPGVLRRGDVLSVEVTGDGPAMGLPDALPAFSPPALPVTRRRAFALT